MGGDIQMKMEIYQLREVFMFQNGFSFWKFSKHPCTHHPARYPHGPCLLLEICCSFLPKHFKSSKVQILFTQTSQSEGRVYKSKICLSVCLSSLQDFKYRPFISSQDHARQSGGHARPHISYTAGQRMMSSGDVNGTH